VNRKALGDMGERWAREYLQNHGYRIRETNFRCRKGEVDIVAQEGDCLVFVEVRTRSGPGFGTPEESVTAAKQHRLAAVALSYLQSHRGLPPDWRIDVVAIEADRDGQVARTTLIRNAVS
jgi:putative endonuclease